MEGACDVGCSRSLPAGVVSLLTLGIELPLGLSVDLRGGYLAVGSAVERRLRRPLSTSAGDWSVDYDLRQDPSVRGPLAALGVSRGLALGDRWQLRGALALGVLFATSSDDERGSATSGGARANLLIPGASEGGAGAGGESGTSGQAGGGRWCCRRGGSGRVRNLQTCRRRGRRGGRAA